MSGCPEFNLDALFDSCNNPDRYGPSVLHVSRSVYNELTEAHADVYGVRPVRPIEYRRKKRQRSFVGKSLRLKNKAARIARRKNR